MCIFGNLKLVYPRHSNHNHSCIKGLCRGYFFMGEKESWADNVQGPASGLCCFLLFPVLTQFNAKRQHLSPWLCFLSFLLSFLFSSPILSLSLFSKISCPISYIRYQPQWNDQATHEKFSHHLAVFGQLGSIGGPTFYKQGCRIGRVHMGVQWMNQFEPCAFQVPDGGLGPSDQSGFQMDGWDESIGPYIYLSI